MLGNISATLTVLAGSLGFAFLLVMVCGLIILWLANSKLPYLISGIIIFVMLFAIPFVLSVLGYC